MPRAVIVRGSRGAEPDPVQSAGSAWSIMLFSPPRKRGSLEERKKGVGEGQIELHARFLPLAHDGPMVPGAVKEG